MCKVADFGLSRETVDEIYKVNKVIYMGRQFVYVCIFLLPQTLLHASIMDLIGFLMVYVSLACKCLCYLGWENPCPMDCSRGYL